MTNWPELSLAFYLERSIEQGEHHCSFSMNPLEFALSSKFDSVFVFTEHTIEGLKILNSSSLAVIARPLQIFLVLLNRNLHDTALTGTLPPEWGVNFTNLQRLYVTKNSRIIFFLSSLIN
jgi:hypothetical protein